MKSDLPPNQTQFMTEGLLYEAVEATDDSGQILSEQELKQRQQKKIKWGVGIFIFLLIVVGLTAFIRSRMGVKQEQDLTSEDIELDEVVLGPFNQRLSELGKELELADPNQEELPFPLVNFEISLEE